MKKNVGFIGCGNMGGALARATAAAIGGEQVYLCDAYKEKAKELAQQTGNEMLAQQLAQIIMQRQGVAMPSSTGPADPSKMHAGESTATAIDVGGGNNTQEVTQVKNARERAAKAGSMDQ